MEGHTSVEQGQSFPRNGSTNIHKLAHEACTDLPHSVTKICTSSEHDVIRDYMRQVSLTGGRIIAAEPEADVRVGMTSPPKLKDNSKFCISMLSFNSLKRYFESLDNS